MQFNLRLSTRPRYRSTVLFISYSTCRMYRKFVYILRISYHFLKQPNYTALLDLGSNSPTGLESPLAQAVRSPLEALDEK